MLALLVAHHILYVSRIRVKGRNVISHTNISSYLWFMYISKGKGKGKGKAIPLQAWTGPEGSRKLRLPDFKTIGT